MGGIFFFGGCLAADEAHHFFTSMIMSSEYMYDRHQATVSCPRHAIRICTVLVLRLAGRSCRKSTRSEAELFRKDLRGQADVPSSILQCDGGLTDHVTSKEPIGYSTIITSRCLGAGQ